MTIRYVPFGGSPNYPTISQAVAACSSGDIVQIMDSAVYYECITGFPATHITIQAQIGQHPIIDGTGNIGDVVNINRSTTTLLNLIARNSSDSAGIRIQSSRDFCVIANCISYNNAKDGIRVFGSSNTIRNNICMYNGDFGEHGIDVDGYDNIIDSNKCIGNASDGINVYGDVNTLKNNICERNGIDGIDIDGDVGLGNNIISGNICIFNGGEGIEYNCNSGSITVTNNISLHNTYKDYAKNGTATLIASNNISSDGSEDFSYIPVMDSW